LHGRLRTDEALRGRRRLLETSHGTIAWPLMLAMCAWLAVVFGVFGLLSPRNAVVYLSIVVSAILRRFRRLPDRLFRFSDRRTLAERFHARDLGQNRRALKKRAQVFARSRE
jgi:hypothetical protein